MINIVVLLLFILHVVIGMKRGFVKLAISLLTTVVTLAVVMAVSPYVKTLLTEHTTFRSVIEKRVQPYIGESLGTEGEKPVETQSDIKASGDQLKRLPVPSVLTEAMSDNHNLENYMQDGVTRLTDYVSNYLTDLVLSAVAYILTFVIVFILLRILFHVLRVITYIPVLKQLNALAGGALAFVQGVICIWVLCLVVTAFGGTSWGLSALSMIEESFILRFFYNNNFLLRILLGAAVAL